MDPRYTGRRSPPPRYGQPGRSSTGRLDPYPPDYDNYYGPPRSSRESIVPGPRSSAEQVGVPRSDPRLHRDPLVRAPPREAPPRDDYYVPPRRDPLPSAASRRPLSVIASAESPGRYRPIISSAVDIVPSPYKSRSREDEPYYVLPASSSQQHQRYFSAGGEGNGRFIDAGRDRRPEKGGYRSSGPSKGSMDYPRNVPQVREPRDAQDRDYGYEYTNKEEQVYRDTAPRLRTRRGSDVGPRERPYSVAGGVDEYKRQPREAGPPVTTRGFFKIDPSGTVRHEYRVPRENDPPREDSLVRSSRDDRDPNRLRPPHGSVAVHQDNNDSSSNVEERRHDKHHRHKRNDSLDRDSDRGPGIRHFDERRFDERAKTHQRAESEDRHHRSHRHRDTSEDRFGPKGQSQRHEREDQRDRKHRDEPRKEKRDREDRRERDEKPEKQEKHDHRKLAEGLGLGAAATSLVAEAMKHRNAKDLSDSDSKDGKDRPRRQNRRRADANQETNSRGSETEEDRRDRRRRRRREREEKERKAREEQELGASNNSPRPKDQDRGSQPKEDNEEGEEESNRRSRHRHRKERDGSADSLMDEAARKDKERSRVRVVSPPKEPEKKPKGILRPPTQKFPEDPAPIREGVAPLKDAGKKGIPPGARWTKIDRRLVNPEALEAGNERYEERPDYVIVLRVLSKDEIEKYAEVTQALRDRRSRASTSEAPRAIEARAHNNGYSSDEDRPPLQIASAPYNPSESLPVRDRLVAQDLQPSLSSKPPEIAETVVNAHQRRAAQDAAEDYSDRGGGERDRPRLPTGGSYHRIAPPDVRPASSIPMYPGVPSPVSAPISHDPYAPPPPGVNSIDPAASWHGGMVAGGYPAVPGPGSVPHAYSQGHTPPPPLAPLQGVPTGQAGLGQGQSQGPPIPPKELDPYPSVSEGYQPQGVQ